jgi:hypothetical protein
VGVEHRSVSDVERPVVHGEHVLIITKPDAERVIIDDRQAVTPDIQPGAAVAADGSKTADSTRPDADGHRVDAQQDDDAAQQHTGLSGHRSSSPCAP